MSSELSTPDHTPVRIRRSYSAEFKAQLVAECRTPGTSVASVGRRHGINDNLLHRWLREHDRRPGATELSATAPSFMALPVPAPTDSSSGNIRLEIQRGDVRVTVHWPLSASQASANWLSQVLR